MENTCILIIVNACPYVQLSELTTPQHRNSPYVAVLLQKRNFDNFLPT